MSGAREINRQGPLARLVLIRPGEGAALALSAAYFFTLMFGYFLIRPIRDEMGVAGGVRNLKYLWTATLLVMLAAHPIYTWVVGRLPRRRFIPVVYRFFAINLLVFFVLIRALPEHQVNIGRAFYVWTSVFNLFAVSVFWGFMADAFTNEQGKRLFGAVAVGGTLGTIAGSAVAAALTAGISIAGVAVKIEPAVLMLGCAAMLEVSVQCVRRLVRAFGMDRAEALRTSRPASPEPGRGVWTGLARLAASPYLLLIALYMLCYTVSSTFLYVEQARIAEANFTGRDQRTAFFATVNLLQNGATLILQIALTGRLLRWVGVAPVLLAMPLVAIGGFGLLVASREVVTLLAFQVLSKSVHYAVDRPAREVLYTVLGPEEKYKSKSFIDTFVYRAGDQIGIWSESLLAWLGVATAAAGVGCGVLWCGVAAALGRLHRGRARVEQNAAGEIGETSSASSPA